LKELRNLWLFGAALAIVFFLILQSMLGWSWDAWTIGFVVLGIAWIIFQWWRRYPRG
jgi:hypothetical protein